MDPFVTASGNKTWTSKSTLRLPNGSIETLYRNTASGRETLSVKNGSKGKMIFVGNRRWSPVRAYNRVAMFVQYVPGQTRYSAHGGVRTWDGYPFPDGIWTPYDDVSPISSGSFSFSGHIPVASANILNRIRTELLVKAGRRQVNYGEALGESKSTIRMLADAAKRLVRAYKAARSGRFFNVAKILRVPRLKFPRGTPIARKWLAYQYGWSPLMKDIYDSYKLFRNGLDTRMQVLSVSRRISEQSVITGRRGSFRNCFSRAEAQYTGKMFYRVADNDLSILQQLGLINPAEVAWALVPFSFVVDWFLPVGNFLEALSARIGLTFVDGLYGVKVRVTTHANQLERAVTGETQLGSSSTVLWSFYSGYVRSKMTSMPWPGFYIKSPFSTSHVASAIALITSLRR